MISAWWLLLIVPACMAAGVGALCLGTAVWVRTFYGSER